MDSVNISSALSRIEERITVIENSCKKMDDHIDFVETFCKFIKGFLPVSHLKRPQNDSRTEVYSTF